MGNSVLARKSLDELQLASVFQKAPVDNLHQAEIVAFPETAKLPLVSIVIPVYREEIGINQYLHQLLSTPRVSQCEVLLVDGHPDETTLRAVSPEFKSRIVALQMAKGRAAQMNAGAEKARSDLLLFLHADTLLPPTGISLVVDALTSGHCSAGAFGLSLRTQNRLLRVIAWAGRLRARHTRIPYGDQGIFIRKELFRELGGYSPIPILEDVDLARRLRKSGHLPIILRECISTSARRWEDEGIIRTTLRHRLIMSLYNSHLSPRFIAWMVRR